MKTFDLITQRDLQQFKAELLEDLKQHLKPHAPHQTAWLRSSEVRKMLKISPGTLQNLRINGSLKYNKIGSIHFTGLRMFTLCLRVERKMPNDNIPHH